MHPKKCTVAQNRVIFSKILSVLKPKLGIIIMFTQKFNSIRFDFFNLHKHEKKNKLLT